jgi:hypothetical protein
VVTGPRVQLRIAREQSKLTERQLALQERQFQTTLRQLEFTLFGAAEQRWIDEFRDMVSQLFALSEEASVLHIYLDHDPNNSKELDALNKLNVEAFKSISKIWLHLGNEHEEEFTAKLRPWFFFPGEKFNNNIWVERQREIFVVAQKIMSERREKISFIQTPSAR